MKKKQVKTKKVSPEEIAIESSNEDDSLLFNTTHSNRGLAYLGKLYDRLVTFSVGKFYNKRFLNEALPNTLLLSVASRNPASLLKIYLLVCFVLITFWAICNSLIILIGWIFFILIVLIVVYFVIIEVARVLVFPGSAKPMSRKVEFQIASYYHSYFTKALQVVEKVCLLLVLLLLNLIFTSSSSFFRVSFEV